MTLDNQKSFEKAAKALIAPIRNDFRYLDAEFGVIIKS